MALKCDLHIFFTYHFFYCRHFSRKVTFTYSPCTCRDFHGRTAGHCHGCWTNESEFFQLSNKGKKIPAPKWVIELHHWIIVSYVKQSNSWASFLYSDSSGEECVVGRMHRQRESKKCYIIIFISDIWSWLIVDFLWHTKHASSCHLGL